MHLVLRVPAAAALRGDAQDQTPDFVLAMPNEIMIPGPAAVDSC